MHYLIFDSIISDFGTNTMDDALFADTGLNDMWNNKLFNYITSTMVIYTNPNDEFIEDIVRTAEKHSN